MTIKHANSGDPIAAHWSSATPDQVDAARTRVLHRLQSVPALLGPEATEDQHLQARRDPVSAAWQWQRAAWLSAAVIVFALALFTGRVLRPLVGGESLRSGSQSREVTLDDGSRVEMRPNSELSLGREADGIGITLRAGSVIVNAAKQRSGHLYVRTKDMTVSVVGTVFVVNVTKDGSQVGVIEGEVRVREDTREAIETKLYPGQQVSTSPTLALRPLKDDIAWSRHADVHRAILASFMKNMTATSVPLTPLRDTPPAVQAQGAQIVATAAARPSFDEASIRLCDPDNLPPSPIGARGGGANSMMMTPGRLYAQCVTLATLIRTAYEFAPAQLEFFNASEEPRAARAQRRGMNARFNVVAGMGAEDGQVVRGAPAWVRESSYSIEAVGDAAATTDILRGAMLLDLLERRFQLKAHIEAEQMPGYALVVAPGGLKIRAFQEGDCVPLADVSDAVKSERARRGWTGPILIREAAHFGIKPNCGVYGETNGPNYHFELVGSPPGQIAGFIGRSLGVRVINRTNITERFIYSWDFGIDEQTPGVLNDLKQVKTWNPKPGWDSPMTIPKAPSIFTAVEQLGLKLEPIRVPREFIVIDRVERPSPN
jgi:uncharacterized protein (TIGR03435 family)